MKKLILSIGLIVSTSFIGFSQSTYELLLINNILSGKYDKVLACTRSENFNRFGITKDLLPSTTYTKQKLGVFTNTTNFNSKPIFKEEDIINEFKKIKKFVGVSNLNQLYKVSDIDTLASWSDIITDFKIVMNDDSTSCDIQDVQSYLKCYIFNKVEDGKKTSCGVSFAFSDYKLTSISVSFYDFERR